MKRLLSGFRLFFTSFCAVLKHVPPIKEQYVFVVGCLCLCLHFDNNGLAFVFILLLILMGLIDLE